MTGTKTLAAIGGIVLLSGIAMMVVLHEFGSRHFAMGSAGMPWSHPMMHGKARSAGPWLWDQLRWRYGLAAY
jgi:hypothetical protein